MNTFEAGNLTFENFVTLSKKDLEEVLTWRNDERVRKQMLTKDEISLQQHLQFVESLKSTKEKLYFRVKWKETPIGVIDYYDIKQNSASWGLYLNPEQMGSGWGLCLGYAVMECGFEVLKLNKLFCVCLKSNEKALRIYHFLKLAETGTNGDIINLAISKETWVSNRESIKPFIKALNQ